MARPAAATRSMTFGDAARLDPDDAAGELDAGAWVPMTRNTWRHGQIVSKITFLLMTWSRERPEWIVSTGDPGTKLGHGPDTLRGPDIGVVHRDRMPAGRGEHGWLDGAPDLVVEVLGDAQTMADAVEKALQFLRAGAKIVWLVDREAERVVVMTPPDHTRVAGPQATLDGADALPELRVQVADVFAR